MEQTQEEKEALDSMVTEHGLNHAICPNYSAHWKNVRLSSDFMFDHDARFLVNRLAKNEFGYKDVELRTHTYNQNKEIYISYNLGKKFPFDKIVNDGSGSSLQEWYFAGRSERYMSVLEHRWNHGFVFMSYSDRVQLALQHMVDNQVEAIEDVALYVNRLIGAKESIVGEIQTLSKKEKLSPQLAKVLDMMASSVTIDMVNRIQYLGDEDTSEDEDTDN